MDSIRYDSPFARLVGEALRDEPVTLVDIGCNGGLPHGWRAFGDRLRALGVDSESAGIAELTAAEQNPAVRYLAAFIDGGDGLPPANNPWMRLAVHDWLARHGQRAPGVQSAAEAPADVPWVRLPDAVARAGLDQVDFLKIDVDGPDFGILASFAADLETRGVLGVGVEVNFIGSADEREHSFHNTDRLLRRAGFDLFDLSLRRYSAAALPGRSRLAYPAETLFGRVLQGDAVYFRDLCAPHNAALAASLPAERIAKLAAMFDLFALPDCAAEVLVAFKERLTPFLDVTRGLNLLAAQAQPDDSRPMGYETYRAAARADDPWFRLGGGAPALLRPRFDAAPGHASTAYTAANCVVHGAATCDGAETLTIVTGEGRWSFAVEFPLDRGALAPDARLTLDIEVEVQSGAVGIGVLDLSRAAFHEEVEAAAGAGPVRIGLATPAVSLTDALMVRNLAQDGSPSRLTLRLLRVTASH